MDETYNLKVIILNQEPSRENDSRVSVFSLEKGKIELVARGTKKIISKMAGHLQPISLVEIMAVRGRQFDYIGSAAGENYFIHIKNDLEKLTLAGEVINIFSKLVKSEEKDERLFITLKDYLNLLNDNKLYVRDHKLLFYFFILKLLTKLGYQPELYSCVVCRRKIASDNNNFSLRKGGVVCSYCQVATSKYDLSISGDAIKVMRFILENDWPRLLKLKISNKLKEELTVLLSSFFKYNQ